MTHEEQYHQLYDSLISEAETVHTRIQTEIRRGLWALVGVTVLFLALLFLSKGSKVIFLLLWILIMFCLAALLMVMEYVNYLLKNTIEKVTRQEHENLEKVLTLPKLRPLNVPRRLSRAERAAKNGAAEPDGQEAPPPVAADNADAAAKEAASEQNAAESKAMVDAAEAYLMEAVLESMEEHGAEEETAEPPVDDVAPCPDAEEMGGGEQ